MWLFIVLSLVLPKSWGEIQVLWQDPQDSRVDYAARLRADGDASSPVKAYRQKFPRGEARDRLSTLFADAQKKFLSQNSELAAQKYLEIANLISQEDWSRSDRGLFAVTFLRLAQLELNTEQQDQWLTQVILLGDVGVDRKLFPPPLMVRMDRLRGQFPWRKDVVSALKDGWSQLIINGNACEVDGCAAWPDTSEKVRVTFLSDQWKPVTERMLIREIANFKPQRLAWSDADCSDFFGAQCSNRSLRLQRSLRARETDVSAQSGSRPLQLPGAPEPSMPSALKNKWLWIGVGALTAAVLIHQSQEKKTERQPTTTYGF